jgi:3-hydroxy acid dehydrogenase/malonic semialdehyde reductase
MQPLAAADVADAVLWCVSRPAHVNVTVMQIFPAAQAFSPFAVKRA